MTTKSVVLTLLKWLEKNRIKNVFYYIIISKTDYYAKVYSNFNFKNY